MDVSPPDHGIYTFGPFTLDPVRRVLRSGDTPIRLTARLFDLLVYMVRAEGRLIDKDELLAAIWGGRIVEEANLTQAISALRKVLQAEGGDAGFIVTAPGRGYRFAAPVRLESGAPAFHTVVAPAFATPVTARPWWHRWRLPAGAIGALLLAAALFLLRAILPSPAPAVRSAAPFFPPPHSVAVLAFTNMSDNPADDLFAEGLSEELINALSRVDSLQVAARVSAFSFKGKSATIGDIARQLNVGAVLEGSVRRDGNRIRISAQLINALTGYQYWSRSEDRDAGGMLHVQTDLAEAVASALQVTLFGNDVTRLTLGSTANQAAMDAYLRGMKLMRSGEDAGFQAALAAFDQAVALDPAFARGDIGRAYALVNIALSTSCPDPAVPRKLFTDALAAADRAIALAPGLASGHAARATILDNGFLDPAGAAAEAAHAVALEPGNAAVQGNYAQVALDAGHTAEGLAAARRATVLDPLRPDAWENLAYVLYEAGAYDEAMDAIGHEKALASGLPSHSFDLLGRIDLMRGDAAAAARDCARGSQDFSMRCLAMAYHRLGRQQDALAQLTKLRAADGDTAPFAFAEIYAQWGQVADAGLALEAAYQTRDPALEQIKADPLLIPVRDTAAFRRIEALLKFPA
jgi:serine/threonine-protein kinase